MLMLSLSKSSVVQYQRSLEIIKRGNENVLVFHNVNCTCFSCHLLSFYFGGKSIYVHSLLAADRTEER